MARTRETFGSHANTAHAWAQQSHAYGRASDRRMYFEGATLFSYGSHFPMARFLPDTFKGKRVVLINADNYSVSTTRHQSYMRDALRGLDVLRVPIPNLAGLARYGAPLREDLDAAFEAMCANLAGEAWPSWGAPSATRDAIEAFKRAFKYRRPIPADPAAWLAKRNAEAKRKADADKLNDALRRVKAIDPKLTTLRARAIEPDASAWSINGELNQIERCLTEVRRARLVLGKAKRFPRLVAKASAALKDATPIRDAWRGALANAEAREYRERNLSELASVRAWIEGKSDKPQRLFWNYEGVARLWALAIAEDMPDVAEALAGHVQAEMLRREYEARFPTPYKFRRHDDLTPEQWRAGKGGACDLPHPSAPYQNGMATLIRRKGDHLETSRGAVVPWRSAVRAFRFAQECRRNGQAWQRNGHQVPVGPYQLDAIDADGNVTAGCHRLDWQEIEACAVREIPGELAPTFPLPVPLAR